MENDEVFSEIKKDIVSTLFSLRKVLLAYEVIALCACVIRGVYISLQNGNRLLSSTLIESSVQGILVANLLVPVVLLCLCMLLVLFWLPSMVAKKRGHSYTNLIRILNFAGIFTIVTWFIAAAWAMFPSEKSLIDPLVGNVTGLGRRNVGDTIGAVQHGMNRGNEFEKDTDKKIDSLIDMHSKGLISDEEFSRKKTMIIQRSA